MNFLRQIHDILWDWPALVLILGVGLYLTVRLKFPQFTMLPGALRSLLKKPEASEQGNVSPFQALCTALGATVGTGNIVGVAGALCVGGPGAVFWMWICSIIGMAVKFAEVTLAVHYRVLKDGEYVGGSMYMISRGLSPRWHWLAGCYSLLGVAAAFGIGNATQVNAMVVGVNRMLAAFGGKESLWGNFLIGVLIAGFMGAVLFGGVRRIGTIAERMVPAASAGYLLLCVIVLILRRDALPAALKSVFTGAFRPCAVTGGIIGSALTGLRVGCARGVFSNEAGMGTASIAHAAAQVAHPAQQGMLGLVEVFVDTIVICTLTALAVLCSGIPIPYGHDVGAALASDAFRAVYGNWVTMVLTAFLCVFGLATLIGWGLYGTRCGQYLLGHDFWKHFAILQMAGVVLGAVTRTEVVWLVAETVNGLMAIPNLIALAALSPVLLRLVKEYKNGG